MALTRTAVRCRGDAGLGGPKVLSSAKAVHRGPCQHRMRAACRGDVFEMTPASLPRRRPGKACGTENEKARSPDRYSSSVAAAGHVADDGQNGLHMANRSGRAVGGDRSQWAPACLPHVVLQEALDYLQALQQGFSVRGGGR